MRMDMGWGWALGTLLMCTGSAAMASLWTHWAYHQEKKRRDARELEERKRKARKDAGFE